MKHLPTLLTSTALALVLGLPQPALASPDLDDVTMEVMEHDDPDEIMHDIPLPGEDADKDEHKHDGAHEEEEHHDEDMDDDDKHGDEDKEDRDDDKDDRDDDKDDDKGDREDGKEDREDDMDDGKNG